MKFTKKLQEGLVKQSESVAKSAIDRLGVSEKLESTQKSQDEFQKRELEIFSALVKRVDETKRLVREIHKEVVGKK